MSKTFKPMLADPWLGDLPFPRLGSVKIDGIRVLCLNGGLKTRKMLDLPNDYIRGILGDQALHGLDGEIAAGNPWDKNLMQQTTSLAMSPDKVGDFVYLVFDLCTPEHKALPYHERFSLLVEQVKALPEETKRFILIVEQRILENNEALLAYEDEVLEVGYEGVMLRDPRAAYKWGRSTSKGGELLKLKRYEQDEALVIGWEEEEANNNEATKDELGRTKRSSAQAGKVGKGVLGKLVCTTLDSKHFKAGVEFRCSGFTAKQKAELWEIRDQLAGRFITYKHFARGIKDAPRHPNFKAFRDARDMGEPA